MRVAVGTCLLLAVSLSACGDNGGTLRGSDVAAQIRSGLPADRAYCPDEIPMKKGKIVDCVAQEGAAQPVIVRVTQDDSEGHYSYDPTRQKASGDARICQDLAADALQGARDVARLLKQAETQPRERDVYLYQATNRVDDSRDEFAPYAAAGCDLGEVPQAVQQMYARR